VYTDVFQFVFAMSGSIALAYYVLKAPEVGGLAGLRAPCLKKRSPSFRPLAAKLQVGQLPNLIGFFPWLSLEWYGGPRGTRVQNPVEADTAHNECSQPKTNAQFFSSQCIVPDRPLRSAPVAMDY